MPTENRSSSNQEIRTFTLDSLTTALEQVQALHEISADLIAQSVFGQPDQQGQGEPIMLTAVATLEEDGDGGLEPNWLLEGGTAELLAGMTLLVADNAPHLCAEDVSAQLYTHADPAEVEMLRQRMLTYEGIAESHADACAAALTKLAEAQALLRRAVNGGDDGLGLDIDVFLSASAEPSAPLPPVNGDLLPPIGSKVLIHLAREDKWVEHTVVGYYAWENHRPDPSVHRVFVRVRDAEGYLNARLLSDVRPIDKAPLSCNPTSL